MPYYSRIKKFVNVVAAITYFLQDRMEIKIINLKKKSSYVNNNQKKSYFRMYTVS